MLYNTVHQISKKNRHHDQYHRNPKMRKIHVTSSRNITQTDHTSTKFLYRKIGDRPSSVSISHVEAIRLGSILYFSKHNGEKFAFLLAIVTAIDPLILIRNQTTPLIRSVLIQFGENGLHLHYNFNVSDHSIVIIMDCGHISCKWFILLHYYRGKKCIIIIKMPSLQLHRILGIPLHLFHSRMIVKNRHHLLDIIPGRIHVYPIQKRIVTHQSLQSSDIRIVIIQDFICCQCFPGHRRI